MINKTNKTIGIYGWSTGENSFGCGKNHLDFCDKFGNVRILAPWETVESANVDLLYLPGGADTHPANYGQTPSFNSQNADVFKDFVLRERLKGYVDEGVAVFGVCLGMQQLNVHFGGTLIQHLIYHEQSSGRWGKAHKVYTRLKADGAIDKGSPKFDVNSHHHQAVTIQTLSEELRPILFTENEDDIHGVTKNGHIVEGFRHKELPIAGVQYHPEEWYDAVATRIMSQLLED